MPRVAIVGSFSTGKATLAEAVAEQLDLPLLPEVAREVASLGFKLDKDATPEVETLIFLRQLYNEMIHDDFVGDRSLIDVMAYAGWVLDNQERRREFACCDACLQAAEYQLRSQYSHVCYLQIAFPIVPDRLRRVNPGFEKELDERMSRWLDANHFSFIRGDSSGTAAVLRTVDLKTSMTTDVFSSPTGINVYGWSPDGQTVAYITTDSSGYPHLSYRSVPDGATQPVATLARALGRGVGSSDESLIQFSKDGSFVLVVYTPADGTGAAIPPEQSQFQVRSS